MSFNQPATTYRWKETTKPRDLPSFTVISRDVIEKKKVIFEKKVTKQRDAAFKKGCGFIKFQEKF